MPGKSSRRALSVLLVACLVMLGAPVLPASAAANFTGGLVDAPRYVSNDHTPFGVTISPTTATGLTPLTEYRVKLRFTEGTAPSPSTNRGFIWNGVSRNWVQEGADWSVCPTVTTDPSGLLPNQWLYGKFGDTSRSGDYRLMLSLKAGNADTLNASVLPTVTVLDTATQAGKVHNGVATGQAAARAELTDPASSTIVWSLTKSELNLVDSDSDGLVDNAEENRGPAGLPGDYTLVVPAATTCDLRLKRAATLNDLVSGPADTDIALGAAEIVPPSAPATASAEPTTTGVSVSWDPATDNVGVTGYRIYRFAVATTVASYSPVARLVASLAPAASEWTDTGVVAGVRYSYEVRAVDAATNVGPRATATMPVPPHVVDLTRTAGEDRYDTAIAISEATFAASSVTTAVIATGRNFPDALSASGLAGAYGAPVLLVGDSVTASLTAEIDRLGATDVAIVGGTAAVSSAIATQLDVDYEVKRIDGGDRYETAAKVAKRLKQAGGRASTAFIARGDAFPDALSAAPFASGRAMPILLTRTTGLPGYTSSALTEIGTVSAVVLGGTSAVSDVVVVDLEAQLAGTVERWDGIDRYETSVKAAEAGIAKGWAAWGTVGIATGANYPDALGGGTAIGSRGGVLLLTAPTSLSPVTSAALASNIDAIDSIEFLGGPSALGTDVYDAVEALLP